MLERKGLAVDAQGRVSRIVDGVLEPLTDDELDTRRGSESDLPPREEAPCAGAGSRRSWAQLAERVASLERGAANSLPSRRD